MSGVLCHHCGGTDFYKESGYFYCNDCQLQSQDIVERVFERDDIVHNKSSRKITSTSKSSKADKEITSWECYNYVLFGLTNELIQLGAQPNFKLTVKLLWMIYLEKLQVINANKDEMPKLQAVNSARDAAIIYRKLRKRKRKNSTSSDELDVTSVESSLVKSERTKRKRALIRAQFDHSQAQESQDSPSLHNETLYSLQSNSDKSKKSNPVCYNVYASKVLRKTQSGGHLRKHRHDLDNDMKCHKITYAKLDSVSYKYVRGPYILSPNKLYIILYIALLITGDKIQLGDLLRFINEGYLSFNRYSHLFPEDFEDKKINFHDTTKRQPLSHNKFRIYTADMIAFLKVEKYLTGPNLYELCERYCKELNLPADVFDCCKNLMCRSKLRMSFKRSYKAVPNYEGRIMSFIMFVLKLLFGLDGITEFEFENYAKSLNKSRSLDRKMFNLIDWLKYIEYRNFVLREHHFPTNFLHSNRIDNTERFLNFISSVNYGEGTAFRGRDDYKAILNKLESFNSRLMKEIRFSKSLTPLIDNVKILSQCVLPNTYLKDILLKNFTNDSLTFLLKPNKFLKILEKNRKIRIVNGGANENWIIGEFKRMGNGSLKDKQKLVTVKLSTKPKKKRSTPIAKCIKSVSIYRQYYAINNKKNFSKNRRYLEEVSRDVDLDLKSVAQDLTNEQQTYEKHYNPFETYWITACAHVGFLDVEECSEFLTKYPPNFRLIFQECRRIVWQSEAELLDEFILTELYLAFIAKYKLTYKRNLVKNDMMQNYLNKITSCW